MSYDVTVLDESFNITSNLRQFFVDFDVYPGGWEGKPRSEVGDSIERALVAIRDRDARDLAEQYDAPNGWGKVEHAIPFLEEILAACRKPMSSEIVSVWR